MGYAKRTVVLRCRTYYCFSPCKGSIRDHAVVSSPWSYGGESARGGGTAGGQPAGASLTLLKLGACGLAWLAWRRGSLRLLRGINVIFAVTVLWNLAAIAQT